jgi:hypothetical protein
MNAQSIEVSLTRKLRQLMELPEVTLTAEEADLFRIQHIDQLSFDELVDEKGDYDHE